MSAHKERTGAKYYIFENGDPLQDAETSYAYIKVFKGPLPPLTIEQHEALGRRCTRDILKDFAIAAREYKATKAALRGGNVATDASEEGESEEPEADDVSVEAASVQAIETPETWSQDEAESDLIAIGMSESLANVQAVSTAQSSLNEESQIMPVAEVEEPANVQVVSTAQSSFNDKSEIRPVAEIEEPANVQAVSTCRVAPRRRPRRQVLRTSTGARGHSLEEDPIIFSAENNKNYDPQAFWGSSWNRSVGEESAPRPYPKFGRNRGQPPPPQGQDRIENYMSPRIIKRDIIDVD